MQTRPTRQLSLYTFPLLHEKSAVYMYKIKTLTDGKTLPATYTMISFPRKNNEPRPQRPYATPQKPDSRNTKEQRKLILGGRTSDCVWIQPRFSKKRFPFFPIANPRTKNHFAGKIF